MDNLSKALCWLEMVTEAYEGCGDSESAEYGRLLHRTVIEQQTYDKNGEPDKKSGNDHQNDATWYPIVFQMPIRRPTSTAVKIAF